MGCKRSESLLLIPPLVRHTWVPFGPVIRRLREAKGMSPEKFLKLAQLKAEETLERLERRKTMTLPYGKLLEYAQILGCEVMTIGCSIEDVASANPDHLPLDIAARLRNGKPMPRSGKDTPDGVAGEANRKFISDLQAMADAEEDAGEDKPPPARWDDGDYPILNATALWKIHSGPAAHENRIYSTSGRVANQRRMNLEQDVLQCHTEGSRFKLERPVPKFRRPLALSLLTRKVAHTDLLQELLKHDARILVRVLVSRKDAVQAGRFSVTNPDGGQRLVCPPEWNGFFVFDTTKTTPWGLLVERVSPVVEAAVKQRKRK